MPCTHSDRWCLTSNMLFVCDADKIGPSSLCCDDGGVVSVGLPESHRGGRHRFSCRCITVRERPWRCLIHFWGLKSSSHHAPLCAPFLRGHVLTRAGAVCAHLFHLWFRRDGGRWSGVPSITVAVVLPRAWPGVTHLFHHPFAFCEGDHRSILSLATIYMVFAWPWPIGAGGALTVVFSGHEGGGGPASILHDVTEVLAGSRPSGLCVVAT
mmetsp:Transcript_1784/g.5707  ORF Transcript_1784/g.5707 Transcript_1784/m.5707 type:complete len:211 (-) Transcript_1784:178-810(-)